MGIRQHAQGRFFGHSAHTSKYRAIFRKHVFTLLKLGYDLLDKSKLLNEQEPAITGDLAQAMNTVKHRPGQPQWMYNLAVHDDPPLNTTPRRGKCRPRADLTIELTGTSAYWEFTFEAKRFYERSGVSEYLGRDGLGMFVCGIYAPDAQDVGMLGYVQYKNIAYWEEKLFQTMAQNSPRAEAFVEGLSTFHTRHNRDNGSLFLVHHALLLLQ
jgi:hypothetical protein